MRALLIAASLLALASCARGSLPADARPPRGCGARGVAVQVLGSGGPIADDDRASSGYVVWVEGKAKALVDLGGGTFQRLGAAGVDARDLRVVLLSHLHVDHAADLPALLKSASFGAREKPLTLVGPSGDDRFPSLQRFVASLIGPDGAFRYLRGYLEGGSPFPLELSEVDVAASEPSVPFEEDGLTVQAVGVPHGPVPALGFVVEAGGAHVAFTGDQRMDARRFVEMIRAADLLVAHHAIPEDATSTMRTLHAPPSRIGEVAADAGVGALVLSHHMRRSLDDAARGARAIRARYSGPVASANDLDCFPVR